jgi:hypothetical protein
VALKAQSRKATGEVPARAARGNMTKENAGMNSETIAKIRADVSNPKPAPWEVNQAANTQCGETIGGSYASSKVSQPISTAESMVYEIARRGEDARTQQVRAKQALDFFEANPAFVEFVDLLKNGVITLY